MVRFRPSNLKPRRETLLSADRLPRLPVSGKTVHILSRWVIDFLERRQRLAPFQRRFIRGAFRPGVDLAALCGPRGLGKSSLSGELLSAALDPDGPLHEPGSESVLLAGSLDQARAAFRFLRARCPEDRGFKYTDFGQRVSVHHKATNTRVRVASSDAKRAFGIVGARLVVGDEPAAWQERGGALMYDALSTAGGKNEMLLLLIGTLAPGSPTGWWHKLIETGNGDPGVYVQVHRAPVDTDGEVQGWSRWATVKRCNPLVGYNPHLAPKLKNELIKARRDDDARRQFLSFRLNRPTVDLSTHLVTAEAWKAALARPVPPRDGPAVLGLDVGASRSWSAAALCWRSGRCEVYASVPGIPSLDDLERRDGLPRGELQRHVTAGVMAVAEGRHVARIETLFSLLPDVEIEGVVADRFLSGPLQDALSDRGLYTVEWRVNQWSTASEDVANFRRAVLDGTLAVVPAGRRLATLSLSHAEIKADDSGSVRLNKASMSRRDDVAAAIVLGVSACARWTEPVAPVVCVA